MKKTRFFFVVVVFDPCVFGYFKFLFNIKSSYIFELNVRNWIVDVHFTEQGFCVAFWTKSECQCV